MYGDIANKWIDQNQQRLIDMGEQIWDFNEPGLKEYKSSALLRDFLRDEGFAIEENLSEMPTAFKASWGKGKPVICYLGEYDSLLGSSQKRGPKREPIEPGGPGHACGHNIFGVAMAGAAVALKNELEAEKLPGTVVFFGCPAEEFLLGKIYMARDGYFEGMDIIMTWHPDTTNSPDESIFQAMYNVKFNFYGIPAHASESPEQGRSALDAVELMNVGVNYLREHMVSTARIHYAITHGGGPPNTVPEYAQVWYFVRGPEKETARQLFGRVCKIAEAAAMMTETRVERKLITACAENLPNDVVLQALANAIDITPPPQWDEDDYAFAKEIVASFEPAAYNKTIERLEKTFGCELSEKEKLICGKRYPLTGNHPHLPLGSSDFGDVTWFAPSAMAYMATFPVNTPYHSWQMAASAASGVAQKGSVFTSRVFALAGLDFVHHPEKVEAAWAEFNKRTKGVPFVSLLDPDATVPFDELDIK